MRPREGEIWENRRSGRTCEVKMVKEGRVSYRYRYPLDSDTTKHNYMSVARFVAAFAKALSEVRP